MWGCARDSVHRRALALPGTGSFDDPRVGPSHGLRGSTYGRLKAAQQMATFGRPTKRSMTDPRTDQIAREAARLIETGRVGSIDDAIRAAATALNLHEVPMPGQGRVRKHVQAMSMQALGDEGYAESVRNVQEIAEQLMTALEQAMPDDPTLLVGRAAKGLIDAGVTIHIRIYTKEPIDQIAQALADFDYDEPTFETAETSVGRLNRIRLTEDGVEIVLTHCLPEMIKDAHVDLFKGQPIEAVTLEELRDMLK